MAMPEVVKALSHEFYGLHDAGAIPTHAYISTDDWAALCEWLGHSTGATTITLRWPVGRRRDKRRHRVRYHRQGSFGVD